MRRGLLAWSEDEVPRAVLDARVERCRQAMRDAGLDCMALYTSFPRPAAVSWLTHFVPYWSQGLLLVFADAPPALVVSLSRRVSEWIRTTAHVADIVNTPDPGGEAAALIGRTCPGIRRLGVVELAVLPAGIARPLLAGLPGIALEDASSVFAAARHPADAVEIALSERAAAISATALSEGTGGDHQEAGTLISAIEGRARLMGAEDVVVLVAPDLETDPRLRRIEGPARLGARYAAQASVAYKGHWVRLGRAVAAADEEPESWREARRWLNDAVPALGDGMRRDRLLAEAAAWSIECCAGSRPLIALAGSHLPSAGDPPAGAIVVFNLRLDRADGPSLWTEPVLLGEAGGDPARSLVPA